ncbi:MAG: type IV pilus biogenesis/stability protein PilW [Neisseria sp.]|nr:type IV pilus biogenesis/stability protein PilW [Neisseria sp.]
MKTGVWISALACSGLLLAACANDGLHRPSKQERRSEVARIQTQLALEYMRIGDYRAAVATADEAIANEPKNETIWLVRAQIHQALGMDGMAEQGFQTALKLKPDSAEANNNYGWFLCSRRHQPQQAAAYFDRALADPTYPEPYVAYLNKGICAAKNTQYAEAEQYLRRALDFAPDFLPVQKELMRVKFLSGDSHTALQIWQDYASRVREPDSDGLLLAWRAAKAAGSNAQMKQLEAALQARFPNSEELKLLKQE